MDGKEARLDRILLDGKAVVVPMDHGMTLGPVRGLEDVSSAVESASAGGATAVVLHKGLVKAIRPPSCGVIMHLSASTSVSPDPNRKVLVGGVREALRLGCDAVSVHVNVGGSDAEAEMVSALGRVSAECEELQVPLLAMMYARGKNVAGADGPESVALVARVGAELGADIVKCPYTGDVESFRRVVRGCPVPVVIAGGPKMESDADVLEMAEQAMKAGAAGVSIGRNVFQHASPSAMVKALRAVVVGGARAKDALSALSAR